MRPQCPPPKESQKELTRQKKESFLNFPNYFLFCCLRSPAAPAGGPRDGLRRLHSVGRGPGRPQRRRLWPGPEGFLPSPLSFPCRHMPCPPLPWMPIPLPPLRSPPPKRPGAHPSTKLNPPSDRIQPPSDVGMVLFASDKVGRSRPKDRKGWFRGFPLLCRWNGPAPGLLSEQLLLRVEILGFIGPLHHHHSPSIPLVIEIKSTFQYNILPPIFPRLAFSEVSMLSRILGFYFFLNAPL